MQLSFSEKNILHLLTILESIEKIKIYSNGYTNPDVFFYSDDQLPFNASCHLLLAISEETKKLDENLKDEFAFIAWNQISGLRNRIAHDYRGIDPEVIFQIISFELDALKEACINMLKLMHIPVEKLNDYLKTSFYSHLNYLIVN